MELAEAVHFTKALAKQRIYFPHFSQFITAKRGAIETVTVRTIDKRFGEAVLLMPLVAGRLVNDCRVQACQQTGIPQPVFFHAN